MAKKSKWPGVEARLNEIQNWARNGLTDKQIAANLGISRTTLNEYRQARPELQEALNTGKMLCIAELENALVKRALGFEFEETKTYIKYEDGKEVKYQERIKRYCPPHVGACIILLKNKDRDGNGGAGWSDDPVKRDLDRELLEFRKQMDTIKNW